MSYYAEYSYAFGKTLLKNREKTRNACFGELFDNISSRSLQDLKLNVSMLAKKGVCHKLEFSIEDINYVFDRLAHVIDKPEIVPIEGTENISVNFIFTQKSSGHIKVATTLCRYFYEQCESNTKRSFKVIMRDSIEHARNNPEVPFIEVLQLFHYCSSENDGHSIVDIYNHEYPTVIISDTTFVSNMQNKDISTINYHTGVFGKFQHDKMPKDYDYLNNLNNITRI